MAQVLDRYLLDGSTIFRATDIQITNAANLLHRHIDRLDGIQPVSVYSICGLEYGSSVNDDDDQDDTASTSSASSFFSTGTTHTETSEAAEIPSPVPLVVQLKPAVRGLLDRTTWTEFLGILEETGLEFPDGVFGIRQEFALQPCRVTGILHTYSRCDTCICCGIQLCKECSYSIIDLANPTAHSVAEFAEQESAAGIAIRHIYSPCASEECRTRIDPVLGDCVCIDIMNDRYSGFPHLNPFLHCGTCYRDAVSELQRAIEPKNVVQTSPPGDPHGDVVVVNVSFCDCGKVSNEGVDSWDEIHICRLCWKKTDGPYMLGEYHGDRV